MGYVNDQKMEEIRLELPEMGNDSMYQTLISTVEKLKEQCPKGLEGVILLVSSTKDVEGKESLTKGEKNVRVLMACDQEMVITTITNLFEELETRAKWMTLMALTGVLREQETGIEGAGGATIH
jgi:uncharacterized Zn finger protein